MKKTVDKETSYYAPSDVFDEDFDSGETYYDDEVPEEDVSKSEEDVCCICGKPIVGYGNNAEPVANGRCCDECNYSKVIPARLKNLNLKEDLDEDDLDLSEAEGHFDYDEAEDDGTLDELLDQSGELIREAANNLGYSNFEWEDSTQGSEGQSDFWIDGDEEGQRLHATCDFSDTWVTTPEAAENLLSGLDWEPEEDLDEDLTKLKEDTHAKYAQPEGDRVSANKNALKYANKYKVPFIYGYTDRNGKFFALNQPIKCTDLKKQTAEFKTKYTRCNVVDVAYPKMIEGYDPTGEYDYDELLDLADYYSENPDDSIDYNLVDELGNTDLSEPISTYDEKKNSVMEYYNKVKSWDSSNAKNRTSCKYNVDIGLLNEWIDEQDKEAKQLNENEVKN